MNRLQPLAVRLWSASAPLTTVGAIMLLALALSVAGIVIDPRHITGVPAWLKPAKFATSTAIYSLTLAWMFTYLPEWRRTRRIVGWTTAMIFVLEVAIIDVQAWRGKTSHFNAETPVDIVLFAIMGLGILIQTLSSIAVAVALWRHTFQDAALGWAFRLGLTITIAGAMTGGLMTRPTEAQLAEARATHQMPVSGAHTVGAPDGGPGLPGTGWSITHGDLRVPHFLGLHAMQALPLIVVALGRRRSELQRVRLTIVGAASYLSLFALLLWQAWRAQSLVQPDATMMVAFGAWLGLTVGAAWVAKGRGTPLPAHAAVA
jgi:hypothetical protein